MVKNSSSILKKTFQELLIKKNIHILFTFDVVICCCVLHNLIFSGKNSNVNALIIELEIENSIDQNENVGEARGEQWIQVDVATHHDFEQINLQVGE